MKPVLSCALTLAVAVMACESEGTVDRGIDALGTPDLAADVTADATQLPDVAELGPDAQDVMVVDAGAHDAASDAGPDAEPLSLQGCTPTSYLDRTAAGADRDLDWDDAFAGDVERCLMIKVGQAVSWTGDLSEHPLVPQGGTTPSPIVAIGNGFGVSYTFTTPGSFGYLCSTHPPMKGAIFVVP
jgi:hypothetical protein